MTLHNQTKSSDFVKTIADSFYETLNSIMSFCNVFIMLCFVKWTLIKKVVCSLLRTAFY